MEVEEVEFDVFGCRHANSRGRVSRLTYEPTPAQRLGWLLAQGVALSAPFITAMVATLWWPR